MIIDTDIKIGNKIGSRVLSVHNRSRPTVQNLSGAAMRQHEQIAEYRHKVNALSAELSSAAQALSAANMEINRLAHALDDAQRINQKLQDELTASARAVPAKTKGKRRKQDASSPSANSPSEAV